MIQLENVSVMKNRFFFWYYNKFLIFLRYSKRGTQNIFKFKKRKIIPGL